MAQYAWVIAVLPVAAFLVIVFTLSRIKEKAAYVAITATGLGLLMSIGALVQTLGHHAFHYQANWMTVGKIVIKVGIYIDSLAAVMLIVVTTVSLLVQIYSLGYMKGEKRISWYYAALSLFTAAMLSLIISDNFLQLYISWELVGLCSYLLIGFWYEKKSASNAAMKAFITTRIGDVGFFLGLVVLFISTKTFDFSAVREIVEAGTLGAGTLTAIALLIFCGAAGKSAQFPLQIWLPDAMEGPTPVSALIHAATMVAAGIYLVARSLFIFEAAYPMAMTVVAGIGAFTAIIAALVAVTQVDIKKILAYSTISQLGFMMAALGIGAYTAALFHLTTHAFFKALLFLGAGSVIHGAGTQNINEMGGLLKKMKKTGWTFLVGTLSLAGIAPLSGFWSKDEILTEAFKTGNYLILAVLLFTAFLTAFYMFRLYFLVFAGPVRDEHAHESPAVMTVPLLILAVPAALLGLAGSPLMGLWLTKLISLPGAHHAASPDYMMMALSTAAAVLGIFLAYLMYYKQAFTAWIIINALTSWSWLNTTFADRMIQKGLRFNLAVGESMSWFDRRVVDGIVNSVGPLAVGGGNRSAWFDRVVVDRVYDSVMGFLQVFSGMFRRINTGSLPQYLNYILAGFVTLAIIVYFAFVVFV